MPFDPLSHAPSSLPAPYQLRDTPDAAYLPDGTINPEWTDLFESIDRHGAPVLEQWRACADRISRERGLAYRPASIETKEESQWSLDPLPWIISPEKWLGLEAGLQQRTRLFEAILVDLYGSQRLIRENLIPPSIVMGNPGFLRSLHRQQPDNHWTGLGISAFDLAWDASGEPKVINDRFDAPYGLGIALENRTVVNKVLPRLFRRCQVRRIGHFFTDWFDFLIRKSNQTDKATPLVAILDSAEKEDNSEISFLANYCQFTRVHPSDLAVRDGKVWIKALRRLVPVHVLWKMIPGIELDSLESNIVHQNGIPGLFEAMRNCGVTVASHPGVRILQSPSVSPYLESISQKLLGEELILKPANSWWCGDATGLSHVLANLPNMVVKSVGNYPEVRTSYASRLSADEIGELRARIQSSPQTFVGQEELQVSTVPATMGDKIVPRQAVLRAFTFLDDINGPQVMPGGLAKVGAGDGVITSTRAGGVSKDVWVRASETQEPVRIAAVLRNRISTTKIVTSRTGSNLFWIGRYAERTQVASRFVARIIEGRRHGFSHDEIFEAEHEAHLVRGLFETFNIAMPEETPDDLLEMLIDDVNSPVSIGYNLERFYNACNNTRESWSPASMMAIERCHREWNDAVAGYTLYFDLENALESMQLNLAAFLGLNLDSMTRDEGWALLDSGRRLDRATSICRLLRFLLEAKVEPDMSQLLNESFLFILDSLRTYQIKFHAIPETSRTTRLLFSEADYPRSIYNLLERLNLDLTKLPEPTADRPHPTKLCRPLMNQLVEFAKNENNGEKFDTAEVAKLAQHIEETLLNLSDNITQSYFNHVGS